MAISQGSVAASVAIVGADLLAGDTNRSSTMNRNLVSIGLAGSAAALDSKVRLMVGNLEVATLFNSATGAVNVNTSMFRLMQPVPAGSIISLLVTDAAATNPLNYALDFQS
jgi:hypothetical protein